MTIIFNFNTSKILKSSEIKLNYSVCLQTFLYKFHKTFAQLLCFFSRLTKKLIDMPLTYFIKAII